MRIKESKPKALLVVYDDFISFRKIRNNIVLAESQLTKEMAKQLIAPLLDENLVNIRFKNPINPKILSYNSYGGNFIVTWYFRSKRKKLFFTEKDKDGIYAIPNLIFKIVNSRLYVVAIDKENLYYAPFYNTSGDSVCMGTASFDLKNYGYVEDLIENVEHLFFNSKFSHGTNNLKTKNKKFFKEYQSLEPYGRTKEDFINPNIFD